MKEEALLVYIRSSNSMSDCIFPVHRILKMKLNLIGYRVSPLISGDNNGKFSLGRGTQREYSSKPLKRSIVKSNFSI